MNKKQMYVFIFILISGSAFASLSKEMREEIPTLYTQTQVNQIVVNTAREVYGLINQNWSYVPAGKGHNPKVEAQNWKAQYIKQRAFSEGKECLVNIPTLVFNGKTEEFENSLENLIQQPATLECTCALTTIKIFALKNLLGDYFVNYVDYFKRQMEEREWASEEFYHELPAQFIEDDQPSNAGPGYIVYISNIPSYLHFKPNGNGRGSNLIQVTEQEYLGFSSIYKEGPQPFNAIAEQDRYLFCLESDVETEHAHHKKICTVINQTPERFYQEFLKAQGKQPVFYFDINRINEFLQTGKFVEFWGN